MKDKVTIGMTWKSFQLALFTLITKGVNDAAANDIDREMKKLCFCADVMIELQKKKLDIPELIGKAKYMKIQKRYD